MTLNGGACIINYSGAVLTKCPKDFDLLFFKVGRAKEKESELVLLLLLNYQLESRVEKDAERFSHLCQCKRLARVLIISRTLLNGSLLPVESQSTVHFVYLTYDGSLLRSRFWGVTQRSGERCVTSQKTAAKETNITAACRLANLDRWTN